LKGNNYTYFIHKKNKDHSINELLETWFCLRVTWNCKPKSMEEQNKKLLILVQSSQWKFIILCPEIVSINLLVHWNLPKSS